MGGRELLSNIVKDTVLAILLISLGMLIKHSIDNNTKNLTPDMFEQHIKDK